METGSRLHREIASSGLLASNVYVGSALLHMYVKLGFLTKSQEVLDDLCVRNAVCWNAIILGYTKHRQEKQALFCFEQMQCEGVDPNPVTFVLILKACGNLKDIDKGRVIHEEINQRRPLDRNVFIGTALIDMYVQCGSVEKVEEVFDKLQDRNEVCWNVLITGYVECECGEKALNFIEQMQQECVFPDAITFVCSLKACSSIANENKGLHLHARIVSVDFWKHHLLIGSTLLDMYAKCGSLTEAQEVFDKLPVHDVVSWTALLIGYADQGRGVEALSIFENMQQGGVSPCALTFVCSLKACSSIRGLKKGLEIHAKIVKVGLEGDMEVGNSLVNMYAKCGLLAEAQLMFDALSNHNIMSWNALIAGYAEHGPEAEALNGSEKVRCEGICMNHVTFVCVLKACGALGTVHKGQELHIESVKRGLELDLFVSSALVNMYAKCGLLAEARDLFESLPAPSHVSLTALVAGYSECGFDEEALSIFKKFQQEGTFIDGVTLMSSLKVCGRIGASNAGKEVHTAIAVKGLETEIYIGISLVDMYMKCGMLVEAQGVFDKLSDRDVVLWTSLIAGYVENSCSKEALDCLKQMDQENISPNPFTLACCLRACIYIGATFRGRGLHAEIIKKGLEPELLLGNTLISMYAKWGLLVEAQKVFDKLSAQHIVAWTALMTGYVDYGHNQEALVCMEKMADQRLSPDAVTLVCGLTACGSCGALMKSQELHAVVIKKGFDEEGPIGNTLIDTYGRCGLLESAEKVFSKLRRPDIVSWNALLAAYSELGEREEVFDVFTSMKNKGFKPDEVTFVSILNACNHAGLLEKGKMHFGAICYDHDIIPTSEHYTCLADMYGRAGQLDMALVLIERLPMHPGIVVWHTVLGACQKQGDVELARHVLNYIEGLTMNDVAAYVCVCNTISDFGVTAGMTQAAESLTSKE